MDQTALIVSIVAVVLGGIGLIGGVIGYVQGMNAVARATHARQRAVVAEEEALQARAAAEASARSADELVQRLRAEPQRRAPEGTSPMPSATTGSTLLPPTTGATALREEPRTGPAAVATPAAAPVPTGPTVLPVAAPAVGPAAAPEGDEGILVPSERQHAEHFDIPLPTAGRPVEDTPSDPASGAGSDAAQSAGEVASPSRAAEEPSTDPVAAATPAPVGDERSTESDEQPAQAEGAATAEPAPVADGAEEDAGATRDEQGRVVAGAQDAPTMDWAEVLRTGAIPLPSVSRGTYAPPRRRPKPTGEGPARFELRAIGRQRFEAVNVGGEPAEEARVEGAGEDPHLVRPLSSRPATVPPAGALAFSVLRVEGRHTAVAVVWTRDGQAAQQDLPLE